VASLNEAAAAYGDGLRDEQEVLASIADVVIDVYALESALARARRLVEIRGAESASVALDTVRVFAVDASDRIARSSKQIRRRLGDRSGSRPDLATPIATFQGIDTIAARRRIADAVVAPGRPPF
jgi:Acyl-CoA dehydrogenase, C-terminal domain